MRILLVGDHSDPDCSRALAAVLSSLPGTAVDEAATVGEARALVQRARPDAVFIFLAGTDAGSGVSEAVREFAGDRDGDVDGSPPALAFFGRSEPAGVALPGGSPFFRCPPLDGSAVAAWLGALEGDDDSVDADLPAGGTRLGDYELIERRRVRGSLAIYRAVQTSVNREVALDMLRPSVARDPEAVRGFRATVRAKASVSHQHIAPVFEAHEADGIVFYTRELIHGRTLAQLGRRRTLLPQETILSIARVVAEAFNHFLEKGIPTSPLTAESVYLDQHQEVRLANLALAKRDPAQSQAADLRTLGTALAAVCDQTSLAHVEAGRLIAQMGGYGAAQQTIVTWSALARAAAAAQQKLSDLRSLRPPPGHRAAGGSRRASGRLAWILVGGAAIVLVGLGLGRQWMREAPGDVVSRLDRMTPVPAGPFVYQDGEKRDLGTFWIDEFEVTIAEYAEFLEALAAADDPARWDHPDQPAEKADHFPDRWPEILGAARRGGDFAGRRLALTCPVFLVDWWDAWAYADWKGRRLPTEEEWEKAARGKAGRLFPWGDEPDPAKANLADDGRIDGHAFVGPVDAFPDDLSDFGVRGTAGNVSEWTASETLHPELPDKQVPVVRGGSFVTSPAAARLTSRLTVDDPLERRMSIGFRTVSDSAPDR